ncbi:MAG: SPOR domain-containing protein [Bacteroidales bacterium]|nr:SPOR domain-containing protein [Bacteroidales bacterium]
MKKHLQILFMLMVVLSGCKINQEAYNTAYQKLKDKEETIMNTKAKVAMDVPIDIMVNDTSLNYVYEHFNLILGKETDLSDFNVVARSFINRTNARGFYSQMQDKGYPAVLVQNEENMFRIIVGAASSKEDVEIELKNIKTAYPEAYILIRGSN